VPVLALTPLDEVTADIRALEGWLASSSAPPAAVRVPTGMLGWERVGKRMRILHAGPRGREPLLGAPAALRLACKSGLPELLRAVGAFAARLDGL
jgi:hypothetical protein